MEIDFNTHVKQEAELFGSLKDNLWHEVTDRVQNHKTELAIEAVGAVVISAGFAVATKNPEVLGQAMAPFFKKAIPLAGKAGLVGAGMDWAYKIGAPAIDVWNNPENLEQSKKMLAHNIGGGIVDYTTLTAAGIAGGVAGFKYMYEPKLRAPEFDPRPSLKLNEVPRTVENPEAFTTARSNDLPTDVRKLYEASFPKEERQPTEEVADLVERGRILVHTTRDASGKLEAFSFTSLHDESATKFAGLDFIATDAASRSDGIGSLHLQRVASTIKAERPDLVAMTLEMEHPKEPGLNPEELATRLRRAKFYDRLDAPNTNIKYNIIDFEDPAYRGLAEHRAFVFQPDKFNAVKTAHTFMTDEGGYQLGKFDPAVREFNKNNGYWQPPADIKLNAAGTAIYAGSYPRAFGYDNYDNQIVDKGFK